MKIIKEITKHIDEEMEGICEYIKFGSKVKHEHEYLYDAIVTIVPQEIKHVEMLHESVVREITKAKEQLKSQGKEIPTFMLDAWQEEHEEYVEKMGKIKYKFETLKN